MKLTSKHWGVVILSIVLFIILFFGFDTKSKKQQTLEKSRAVNIEEIDINQRIINSKMNLSPYDLNQIELVEDSLTFVNEDSVKLNLLKKLASKWYSLENYTASGHYAVQIAEVDNSESTWALAGTSLFIALKNTEDAKEKKYLRKKSVIAFEKAISFDPSNIDHRINRALCYVEYPEQDNPMKGILDLVNLNKENPDNISVLSQLGRLALQTNQIAKAKERFLRILELDNNNQLASCYLFEIFSAENNEEVAKKYLYNCENILKK